MEYRPTIGLEIHVELKTQSKMFCACLNDPDEKHPNINVCPVCMGHPGTLPVINRKAVEAVLMLGKSLNGKISKHSRFDRKNYFYPDLPKGYQISQYKYPLVENGELNGVRIRRIHLEEDVGKNIHEKEKSLINFNRAGVPLMELVTEPDIRSAKEAKDFCEEIQLILRYLEISDANMEKGEMRCEINISLSKLGLDQSKGLVGRTSQGEVLGTKVEIKNLNSFRAVEKSIEYEIKRQRDILEKMAKISHETRGWDEKKEETFSQREKEESHDYRYFPEPDLPALDLRKLNFHLEVELPSGKRKRFKEQFKIKDEQINILVQDKKFADYFEKVASELTTSTTSDVIRLAVNYLVSDLQSLMKEKMLDFDNILITPENFAELISLIGENKINSRMAKNILKKMAEKGGDPSLIMEDMKWKQIDDEEAINDFVKQVINENPSAVEDYKNGKETALQYLIGQAMKKSKSGLNPINLSKIFKKNINL